ncbi:hypothetical protein ACOMHN_001736 [Nucella lapillus]
MASAQRNVGPVFELELMQNTRAAEYGEQEDVKRVNKATRRSSQQAQEKRKKIDDIRRRERQAFLAREGPAYGVGEYYIAVRTI